MNHPTVKVDDVIREFERLNFRHVNDTERERPLGDISLSYCYAVVEMAVRLKELDPTWEPNWVPPGWNPKGNG